MGAPCRSRRVADDGHESGHAPSYLAAASTDARTPTPTKWQAQSPTVTTLDPISSTGHYGQAPSTRAANGAHRLDKHAKDELMTRKAGVLRTGRLARAANAERAMPKKEVRSTQLVRDTSLNRRHDTRSRNGHDLPDAHSAQRNNVKHREADGSSSRLPRKAKGATLRREVRGSVSLEADAKKQYSMLVRHHRELAAAKTTEAAKRNKSSGGFSSLRALHEQSPYPTAAQSSHATASLRAASEPVSVPDVVLETRIGKIWYNDGYPDYSNRSGLLD